MASTLHAKATIDELANNCDLLLKHTEGIHIPITRNVSQISEKSIQLAQSPAVVDPNRAQSVLRAGGVDLARLQKDMAHILTDPSTSMTSQDPQALALALRLEDVDSFLALQRDRDIIDAIQTARDETQSHWRTKYQTVLGTEWTTCKRELLASMGVQLSAPSTAVADFSLSRSLPPSLPPSAMGLSLHQGSLPRTLLDEHSANYARIVTNMVSAQKGKPTAHAIPTPYITTNFLQEFENLTRPLQDKGAELNDVWKLLASMVGRATKATPQASGSQLRGAYERRDATLSASLVEGSLAFLQEQYANLIEAEIARQPTTAKQGGIPGEDSTIRAYLNVVYSRAEHRPHVSLTVDNVNGWAYVYFMLRCGWIGPALKFVERHKEKFGAFYPFLNEYVANKRRLSLQTWESCCKEFNSTIRTDKDPYKLTVWNLVSRCDIQEFRPFRGVISSTQDFIWYKLMLVSSENVPEKMKAQDLRLEQVQHQLSSLGPSHFNPSGRSPFIYLFVLLSVQLFEQGVAFLYSSTPYQLEAIHMAIALNYHGLLRVPSLPPSSDIPVELLLVSQNGESIIFNFPRLIHDYASRLITSNPVEALTYCALLDSSALLQCVADIVYNSGDLDMFLGRKFADNNKQEGLIEKFFAKNQTREIQLTVATQAQTSGKIEEAVKLFEVADEPESALQLLIRQLSKQLASRMPDRQRMVHLARDVHKRMQGAQYAALHTPSLAVAFEQLLSMDSFFELVAATKYSEALNHMSALGLIPFHPTNIQSCTATFHRLHEAVKRLFPEMLSTTMQLLTHQHSIIAHIPHSPFDNGRAERVLHIRQAAKSIVTFAGTIQYQIPKDLTAQLLSSELIIRS